MATSSVAEEREFIRNERVLDLHRGKSQKAKRHDKVRQHEIDVSPYQMNSWDDLVRANEDETGWWEDDV